MRGVQVLDPLRHAAVHTPAGRGSRRRPARSSGGCAPRVQVTSPSAFFPADCNSLQVAGDHQPPRPAVLVRDELAGVPIDCGMAGQDRAAPRRVHDESTRCRGQVPHTTTSPGRLPRALRRPARVSSACRRHEPRDRAAMASSSGASSAPACEPAPASVPGAISAPCLASPVTSEFMLRPAANRSVNSIARNPWRKAPSPSPSPAAAPSPSPGPGSRSPAGPGGGSARPPAPRQPVQLLGDMIAARQRGRRPGLRAAVPAVEVPDHLSPGQVRVIPPPRPGSRAPRPPLALRPDPGPPASPAAYRQQAAPAAPAPTTAQTASAAAPPAQRAPLKSSSSRHSSASPLTRSFASSAAASPLRSGAASGVRDSSASHPSASASATTPRHRTANTFGINRESRITPSVSLPEAHPARGWQRSPATTLPGMRNQAPDLSVLTDRDCLITFAAMASCCDNAVRDHEMGYHQGGGTASSPPRA